MHNLRSHSNDISAPLSSFDVLIRDDVAINGIKMQNSKCKVAIFGRFHMTKQVFSFATLILLTQLLFSGELAFLCLLCDFYLHKIRSVDFINIYFSFGIFGVAKRLRRLLSQFY